MPAWPTCVSARHDREAEKATGRFKSAWRTDPSGPGPLVQAWKRHGPLRMMDAMPEFHFYEPSKGHGIPHDPSKAIVTPRLIGWISTRDAEGRVNLVPYFFSNAVCDHPPMIMFSSSGWNDTVSNSKATTPSGPGNCSAAICGTLSSSRLGVRRLGSGFKKSGRQSCDDHI
jgi:hypothetical protein